MEWAMIEKGIPETLVTATMSLYKGAKTKVKVGTLLSEGFEANIGVHQVSVLSPLLFAIVVDVVMNEIKQRMLQEILYTDDIVLIAESMAELRSERCSLHAVALLDPIWIDKWHQHSLPTGKWAQLPFFGLAGHWNPQSGWHYSY